jgi:hypothetical protein
LPLREECNTCSEVGDEVTEVEETEVTEVEETEGTEVEETEGTEDAERASNTETQRHEALRRFSGKGFLECSSRREAAASAHLPVDAAKCPFMLRPGPLCSSRSTK